MTRLYFTCPIQAVLMMKEFGVKFWANTKSRLINEVFADVDVAISIEELLEITELYPKRLYVAKESEHIFEPKEGDIGFNYKGGICRYEDGEWGYTGGLESMVVDPEHNRIIMRNDKQFFQAEVE
tara:strand:+ start:139 stop:513 length:375 start_codon:yes stop_codon:yes gene_type:complete